MRRKKIKIDRSLNPSTGLEIGFTIDWLAFTIKNERPKDAYNFVGAFDDISDRREVRSMHGYNRAWRWKFGALMLWHDTKPHMGVHFILSGSALKDLHELGYGGMFLINKAVLSWAKVTMIHVAMDIINGSFTPLEMYKMFMDKQYNGTSQTASIIQNSYGGQTCYVGSWQSQCFFRFYDKAAEQSIEGFNWKRVELVLKSEYAQEFAYKFADNQDMSNAVKLFRGKVQKMADFDNKDWVAALSGEVTKLSLPKHKERKTREWLLAQVAPALARYVMETGDDSILDDFAEEYQGVLKKLSEGGFE